MLRYKVLKLAIAYCFSFSDLCDCVLISLCVTKTERGHGKETLSKALSLLLALQITITRAGGLTGLFIVKVTDDSLNTNTWRLRQD